jgi:hypothetical protein
MFDSKPHIIYKAICIWLILILLISGLNFILITSSHENLDQRQQTNQTDLTSHKDQTEQSITNKNIGENEERSDLKESKTVLAISNSISTITNHNHASDDDIVQISSDEVLLSNSNKNTDDTEKSRSRANDIFNYDLRISSTISLNYSGFFGWQFPGMNYPFRIVGEVGRPSVFSITIENIGKRFVGHENNAYLTINLTDYLGYSNWEQRDYIGPISPQDKYTMNFTWTPTYSNRFNLTCNLSFQNDQNTSNNIINFYNFLVKKWTDDFEDGDINDWSGDIGLGAWHTTNTIQGDPNPDAHTSPYALYHGIETGFEDDYGEKNDFEIITPELDLRRFEKNRLAFLNFNFYGDSTSELDKFSIAVKKTSDSIWEEINNYEYSGATVNSSNAPEWKTWIYPPINPIYIGIPIHDFVGEIIQFRIHWESDQTPEQKKGFYFDDFFIYGYERPIPDFDLGIDYVMVEPIDEPIVGNFEFSPALQIME